ncbi:MAG: hypothetical protein ACOCXG_00010 [Nanoarchaeota archaeon]
MNVIEKKAKLADLIEEYIANSNKESELLSYIAELREDPDFNDKKLFKDIFDELMNDLPNLPRKYLKQIAAIIRDFNDF